MGLIKSINTPLSLTAYSIRDMEAEAQALLLRARQAAEMLLAEAQKEAESLKQQGKAEGIAQGQREGMAQGLEEGRRMGHQAGLKEMKDQLGKTWEALSAAVGQLESSRHDLEFAGIAEVIDLAAAIARRVTKRQSVIDPAVLTENLRQAMKFAVQAADVRIAIHPSQRKTLGEELPKLQMNWPELKHIELIEDAGIAPGGCRIFTKRGEVNADIDNQLDHVIAELLPAETSNRGAAPSAAT